MNAIGGRLRLGYLIGNIGCESVAEEVTASA